MYDIETCIVFNFNITFPGKMHLRDALYVDWKLEEYHYLRMRCNFITKTYTSSIWINANYKLKGLLKSIT